MSVATKNNNQMLHPQIYGSNNEEGTLDILAVVSPTSPTSGSVPSLQVSSSNSASRWSKLKNAFKKKESTTHNSENNLQHRSNSVNSTSQPNPGGYTSSTLDLSTTIKDNPNRVVSPSFENHDHSQSTPIITTRETHLSQNIHHGRSPHSPSTATRNNSSEALCELNMGASCTSPTTHLMRIPTPTHSMHTDETYASTPSVTSSSVSQSLTSVSSVNGNNLLSSSTSSMSHSISYSTHNNFQSPPQPITSPSSPIVESPNSCFSNSTLLIRAANSNVIQQKSESPDLPIHHPIMSGTPSNSALLSGGNAPLYNIPPLYNNRQYLFVEHEEEGTSPSGLSIASNLSEPSPYSSSSSPNLGRYENEKPQQPPQEQPSTKTRTRPKTAANIKRLISMLTPRRRKNSISEVGPLENTTQQQRAVISNTKLTVTSSSSSVTNDPALLDVANKRKMFEEKTQLGVPSGTNDLKRCSSTLEKKDIEHLQSERLVSQKIKHFSQITPRSNTTTDDIMMPIRSRKSMSSSQFATEKEKAPRENEPKKRLSKSFSEEINILRKSILDLKKRASHGNSSDGPPLTLALDHKALSPNRKLSTASSTNTSSTISSPEVDSELHDVVANEAPAHSRGFSIPSLNFNDEQFKQITEEIGSSLTFGDIATDLLSGEPFSDDEEDGKQHFDTTRKSSMEDMESANDDTSGYQLEEDCQEIVDKPVEETLTEITDFRELKPTFLFGYLLNHFIRNINLSDQDSADKAEQFLDNYLKFCSEAIDQAELKEFSNFSEKDIAKLRDKEKPKSFLLHQCAKHNRSSLIFLLVSKYKCPVDIEDELESCPLHWACSHKAIDSIMVLCQLKAKINIRDKYGKAPIHLLFAKAFQDELNGDTESTKKCFEGAQIMCGMFDGDYNFKTTEGSTVLHYACELGRMETVKFLVSESNDVLNNASAGTAIASAGQSGNKVLLNSKDKIGKTPIMRAATKGHIDIVEYIVINSKPNVVFGPMSRDDKKQNILHQAAMQGNDALINRIAFLNQAACATMMQEQDSSGNSPLHLAVGKGNIKTVNLFLTLLNSDIVNVVNEKGETPLHLACRVKDKRSAERICRYLLQNGANPDVKDSKQQTPKQLAQENELQVEFSKRRR